MAETDHIAGDDSLAGGGDTCLLCDSATCAKCGLCHACFPKALCGKESRTAARRQREYERRNG